MSQIARQVTAYVNEHIRVVHRFGERYANVDDLLIIARKCADQDKSLDDFIRKLELVSSTATQEMP